ncbi:MAG: PilX N-terminal domain-containing pilus assembly protein [Gammaproteobacteria bacterium]
MTNVPHIVRHSQRGIALVTSMLLLAVVTILALAMFRSFGGQEKIASNMREKQRAFHAAESAQQYGEWWLAQGSNAAGGGIACNDLLSADLKQGQICTNLLDSVTNPPLLLGGKKVGVTYTPALDSTGVKMDVKATAGRDTYFDTPRFYITALGAAADGSGDVFQIDAVGYGANPTSVAVVESTFRVKANVIDRGGL